MFYVRLLSFYFLIVLFSFVICVIYSAKATDCLLFKRTVSVGFSHLKFTDYLVGHGHQNINFKLLSLNARGIRSFDRRKSIFNWLFKSPADICFLQETCSTPEVENEWKKQWKGKTFFYH